MGPFDESDPSRHHIHGGTTATNAELNAAGVNSWDDPYSAASKVNEYNRHNFQNTFGPQPAPIYFPSGGGGTFHPDWRVLKIIWIILLPAAIWLSSSAYKDEVSKKILTPVRESYSLSNTTSIGDQQFMFHNMPALMPLRFSFYKNSHLCADVPNCARYRPRESRVVSIFDLEKHSINPNTFRLDLCHKSFGRTHPNVPNSIFEPALINGDGITCVRKNAREVNEAIEISNKNTKSEAFWKYAKPFLLFLLCYIPISALMIVNHRKK